eukprot:gene10650-10809_t
MGKNMINILPVISQLISLFQVACGDVDGAERTQQEFSKGCPVISECRSLVEVATGNIEAARETQVFQARTLEYIAEATPVVGHMAAAAPAAAYGAGVVYDCLHSAATQRPQGLVAVTHRICTNRSNAGEVFDAVAGLAAAGGGVAIAEAGVVEAVPSTAPEANPSAVPTQAPVEDVVAAVATGAADAITNQGNTGQATAVAMEQQPLLQDATRSDTASHAATQDGTNTADTAAPKDQPKSEAEKALIAGGKDYVKKAITSAHVPAGPRNMSHAPLKQE